MRGRPPEVLRGFAKTRVLAPNGGAEEVTFTLAPRDLSEWQSSVAQRRHTRDNGGDDGGDDGGRGWSAVTGEFVALVGFSSRDIRADAPFTVPADTAADAAAVDVARSFTASHRLTNLVVSVGAAVSLGFAALAGAAALCRQRVSSALVE